MFFLLLIRPASSNALKLIISYYFYGETERSGESFPVLSNYIYAF